MNGTTTFRLLSVGVYLLLHQSCASEPPVSDGYEIYRAAFAANTETTLKKLQESNPERIHEAFGSAEIPKLASVMTECHMRAMAEYSETLQKSAYDAMASGSSFLEAKQAFDMALAAEGIAGGEREQNVKQMFAQAGKKGNECLAQLRDG